MDPRDPSLLWRPASDRQRLVSELTTTVLANEEGAANRSDGDRGLHGTSRRMRFNWTQIVRIIDCARKVVGQGNGLSAQ